MTNISDSEAQKEEWKEVHNGERVEKRIEEAYGESADRPKQRKHRSRRKNVVLALVLLLFTNIIMGLILLIQSKSGMRQLINERMMDVAKTAAAMLNGDELKKITTDSQDTPEYKNGYKILKPYQDNIELKYIYAVVEMPDGNFTFAIDPADDEPGSYGELIEKTDGLLKAAKGTASVDQDPHSDRWGSFYSGYAPVFDSEGKVAAIVGTDFDEEWYNSQINTHLITIVIITVITFIIGCFLAYLISGDYRRRFREINQEMRKVDKGFREIGRRIITGAIDKVNLRMDAKENEPLSLLAEGEAPIYSDESEMLQISNILQHMQRDFHVYLDYLDSRVYRDDMTGVLNRAAYRNILNEIEEEITAGTADFAIAVFDMNGLKDINIKYGFPIGDKYLFEIAKILQKVYGDEHVYRISSDEYIVIMRKKLLINMKNYLSHVERETEAYNKARDKSLSELSVAMGTARYTEEEDDSFQSTFLRAEKAMEKDKAEYYDEAFQETVTITE